MQFFTLFSFIQLRSKQINKPVWFLENIQQQTCLCILFISYFQKSMTIVIKASPTISCGNSGEHGDSRLLILHSNRFSIASSCILKLDKININQVCAASNIFLIQESRQIYFQQKKQQREHSQIIIERMVTQSILEHDATVTSPKL